MPKSCCCCSTSSSILRRISRSFSLSSFTSHPSSPHAIINYSNALQSFYSFAKCIKGEKNELEI